MDDRYEKLKKWAPNVTLSNTTFTSDPTTAYNCVAWAVCRDDAYIWPSRNYFGWLYSWPIETRKLTIECFMAAFETYGYTECQSLCNEHRYEKIAIYADNGEPTHVARQLFCGKWTSKLGDTDDICHATLEVLEGETYGTVVKCMKRKRPSSQ